MELALRLDPKASRPLYRQLAEEVRAAILEGRLRPGERLPPSRVLAASLGISRVVVTSAYEELVAEGYLEAWRGSGTYVTRALPDFPRIVRRRGGLQSLPREDQLPESVVDFAPGRPSVERLHPAAWRRMWRAVARELPPAGYGDPAGDPELRAAIAAYLGRARGVGCTAEEVLVTSGAAEAVDLIARAFLRPGDRVAYEEPGYPAARRVLLSRGLTVEPVPVDDDGIRVDLLPSRAALVYVTPSHQFPLGGRLPLARRISLLEWARSAGAFVVEDDYDSELRFHGPPLPALAGLDLSGRVLYMGTFSKVLLPGLRVGYLVAPPELRERLLRMRDPSESHTPWPVQRALAAFLASGDFDRHIRRMRRHYAELRAALREALSPVESLARLRGLEAGLHAFLELSSGLVAEEVARSAAQRGVRVRTLTPYYLGPPTRSGILLGYGGLSLEDVRRGARILAEVIQELAQAG
ncbi:MAG: PLP-dependent aminotransferase family protein [Armatimonadota bacterium]|nr:PLP-dependent aminotransferase family protein [Armatimonadota bacterium]MDR7438350.1 PLP-dependent aminotransferase family protein [Armatimonadota bacterium]MDR7443328.1 PLP-dependent aminotransferase family protein [Armatimonadota bacterium]MDR7563384.1 PLP-dependent aminotransferase family protein [Armatimonadota bacterium]MDR7567141.1 PLP-dependent aminotransferase family protein [Armatimonadota bacterium]